MTKKNFNLIAGLISGVFILAIVYLFAGIISDKKNGPARAESIFEALISDTAHASEIYPVESTEFSAVFIKATGNINNFKSLVLTQNGKVIYSYPVKSISTSSASVIKRSRSLQTPDGSVLSVEAEVFTVKPDSIYFHSKTAFIIIFIATVIALLVLIFAKPALTSNYDDEGDFDETPIDIDSDTKIIIEDVTEPVVIEETPVVEEETASVFENETSQPPSETIAEEPIEDSIEEAVTPPMEQTVSVSTEVIHKETELEANLEEELVNAASSEQDLSVVVVKIADLPNNLEVGAHAAEEIKNITVSSGIIYKYGSDSFVVIIRNTKLDDALSAAEKMNTKITELLSYNGLTNDVTIGISARTERLISAERLLTEAVEAQKHADTKESPIIAFRVNPEKYRNFILNS